MRTVVSVLFILLYRNTVQFTLWIKLVNEVCDESGDIQGQRALKFCLLWIRCLEIHGAVQRYAAVTTHHRVKKRRPAND
jgi:hypothetical protein